MPYHGIIQSYLARDGTPLAFFKLLSYAEIASRNSWYPLLLLPTSCFEEFEGAAGIKSMPPAARYNLPFKISCLMSSSWNRFELFRKGIQRKNDLLQEISF